MNAEDAEPCAPMRSARRPADPRLHPGVGAPLATAKRFLVGAMRAVLSYCL